MYLVIRPIIIIPDIAITNPRTVAEIPRSSKYRGNITTAIDHFKPSEKYKLLKRRYLATMPRSFCV